MTKNYDEKIKSLFDEKTLWSVLEVFEASFPRPLASKKLGILSSTFVFLFLIALGQSRNLSIGELHKASSLLSDYALMISSALLGIVIAGMAIFASSLRPIVASALIQTNYPAKEIPALKFVFAMFVYVLFWLFAMICWCGVYYVFLAEGSLPQSKLVGGNFQLAIQWILIVYFSGLVGLLFFMASLLKSFIWNLHQVLLVVVAFGQGNATK